MLARGRARTSSSAHAFSPRTVTTRPRSRARSASGLFARLASLATGQHVTDPTSGFQVMRSEIARLFSRDVFPVDYPDADILILLHRTGYRVREVPVQMRPSPGSSMHSTQSTPYYVYKMLLSILVTLLRPRSKVTR